MNSCFFISSSVGCFDFYFHFFLSHEKCDSAQQPSYMMYTHVWKHAGGVCADGGRGVEAQNTNQLVDVSKTFSCGVQNKTDLYI